MEMGRFLNLSWRLLLVSSVALALLCQNETHAALTAKPDPLYCQDLATYACSHSEIFDEGIGRTAMAGQSERQALVKKIRAAAILFFKDKMQGDGDFAKAILALAAPGSSNEKIIFELADLAVAVTVPPDTFVEVMGASEWTRIYDLKVQFQYESKTYVPNALVHFHEGLRDQLASPTYLDDVETGTKIVKEKYKELIAKKMVASTELRNRLEKKIGEIQSFGDCGGANPAKADLTSTFTENLAYQPEYNGFFACRGMSLFSSSYFGLIFTIAHEVGHSISPCAIEAPYQVFSPREEVIKPFSYPLTGHETSRRAQAVALAHYPFSKTLQCLMSPDSVAATNVGQVTAAMPSPFCLYGGSQADEAMADALAGEILVQVLKEKLQKEHRRLSHEQFAKGFANIFRFACGKDLDHADSTHPSFKDRYNKILLAHPQVRALMGCQHPLERVRFCGPD